MLDNMTWLPYAAAFTVALVVSAGATPIVRALAVRWKLGNKPNGRDNLHTRLIPHLGGIALVIGALAGMWVTVGGTALPGVADGLPSDFLLRLLPAVALTIALGLVDDTRSLRAPQKLSVQLIAAVMLVLAGFSLYSGIYSIDASTLWLSVLTIAFIVGMSSAVNLVDGHDGLAAGVAMISALSFAVIAWSSGSQLLTASSLAAAGACLGFLFFNFPPGRIYMGDTGSMFLGTILALIACSLSMTRPTWNMFVAVLFILGVPVLDAMLAIARRLVLRSPLFRADSLHVHHVLQQTGFTPRQTLAVLYSMQGVMALFGIGVARGLTIPAVAGTAFAIAAFVAFLRMMVAVRAVGAGAGDLASGAIPLKNNLSGSMSSRRSSSAGR